MKYEYKFQNFLFLVSTYLWHAKLFERNLQWHFRQASLRGGRDKKELIFFCTQFSVMSAVHLIFLINSVHLDPMSSCWSTSALSENSKLCANRNLTSREWRTINLSTKLIAYTNKYLKCWNSFLVEKLT